MNRFISLLILALVSTNSFSQKEMAREFDASLINGIEINSNRINSILIHSEKTNRIKVLTRIEGENYENVVLSVIEKDNILYLKPGYTPFFEAKNDKLAAHKVQAIDIKLIVPENIEISINSKLASVTTKGKLSSLLVTLDIGNCNLHEFIGNANIKTNKGFISVTVIENIYGKAFSKKGAIENMLSKNIESKYKILAETNEGDISLSKSIN